MTKLFDSRRGGFRLDAVDGLLHLRELVEEVILTSAGVLPLVDQNLKRVDDLAELTSVTVCAQDRRFERPVPPSSDH